MDGIEKIIDQITVDAQAELARLEAETAQKAAAIAAEGEARAKKEQDEILARARKAADERLERLQSAARMETRKLELEAKQQVLGEAFDLALEKLSALPEQECVALLAALALEASITGREQLVFSPKDRARIGKQVVLAVNEALLKGVAPELPSSITDSKVGAFLGKVVSSAAAQLTGTGQLTLSEQTRPIPGGFIMVNGDIETNCAFDTLIRLQREKLEKEVANALLQEPK
jgi:V/A-type H+-transporting ATPase subunit E